MIFWLCILVSCALETLGDVLLKKGVLSQGVVIYGIVSYLVGTVLWFTALRYENLSRALPLFSVASALAGVSCGVLVFKEVLTSLQWAGVASGCLCLLLI